MQFSKAAIKLKLKAFCAN